MTSRKKALILELIIYYADLIVARIGRYHIGRLTLEKLLSNNQGIHTRIKFISQQVNSGFPFERV